MPGGWRLPVSPLDILEGQGSGSLGSGGVEEGIFHSFLNHSPTVQGSDPRVQLLPQFHQGESFGGGDSGSYRQGGCGTRVSFSGLLQSHLCGDEGLGNLAPHHRSVHFEQVCHGDQVQDGDCPVGSVFCETGRLDGISGPEGRVSSGPGPSGEQAFSEVRELRSGLPVQSFVLWPDNLSPGLHEGDGSCLVDSPCPGGKNVALPGRLVGPGRVQGSMFSGKGHGDRSLPRIGNNDQLGQIKPGPFPDCNISGDSHQCYDFEGFSNPREAGEALSNHYRVSVLRRATSSLVEGSAGASVLIDPTYPRRSPQDEVPAISSEETMGFLGRKGPGQVGSSVSKGSTVVAGPEAPGERVFPGDCPPGPDVMVRCVGRGLGGSSSGGLRFRPLDSRRTVPLYQLEGVESNTSRSIKIPRTTVGQSGGGVFRQRVCYRLPQESRGYDLSPTQSRSTGDFKMGRNQENSGSSSIHSGSPQCHSRFSLPGEPSGGLGMDLMSRDGEFSGEEVASKYRSVRNVPELPSTSIFRSHERGDGCSSPTLGSLAGLRFSAIFAHPTSPQQVEGFNSHRTDSDCSALAAEGVVSGSLGDAIGTTPTAARAERSTQTASLPSASSRSPRAEPSCLATLQRFARHEGFSRRVARQLTLARRPSTLLVYQQKWSTYRKWCREQGVSVSTPSLPKVADFLLFLHEVKRLSVPCIRGYRSMLSLTFRSKLPKIATSPVLSDLLRSFAIQRPRSVVSPPSWDLDKVLRFLLGNPFEPLREASFKDMTKKVLFLVSLATAKRVGELQALSRHVAYVQDDMSLSYMAGFVAKTESASNPIPRHFILKSLKDFVGNLEEESLLCPVRALSIYLDRTKDLTPRPRSLFVSPNRRLRGISKNALSFLLRETISAAGALVTDEGRGARAHSIRGISTSMAFYRNWSVQRVLQAATWRSNSVFAAFYLKDIALTYESCCSLGPIVVAGQVLSSSSGV